MQLGKQNSKKRMILKIIGVYIVVCIVGAILVNKDSNEESDDSTNSSVIAEDNTENDSNDEVFFEYADVKMQYLRSEIDYNMYDQKCLFVYFEMTNNSDENQAFDYLVSCKAFQNGIEIDENYIYDCDEEENGSKEIQPSATITVAEVFELGDSTDSVILEVRPFNIWSDKLLFEKEIQVTE